MKTILIIVDYQKDFVDGSLGFAEARALEKPICEKIDQVRTHGGEICFTLDTHGENYLATEEGLHLPVVHCIKDGPGWKLFGKVAQAARAQDRCFEKGTFGSLALAQYLQQGGYDRVELVGVVSNICVLCNAVLAKSALPDAQIVVWRDLTASADQRLHHQALDLLENLHITVA